jgi:UDP-N-acetylmuramate dehydrogenase
VQAALSAYTTLGLGGPAARLVEADSDEAIVSAVRAADQTGQPVLVLGGGSNLVVADDGFPGTVVRIASLGITTLPAVNGASADGASAHGASRTARARTARARTGRAGPTGRSGREKGRSGREKGRRGREEGRRGRGKESR